MFYDALNDTDPVVELESSGQTGTMGILATGVGAKGIERNAPAASRWLHLQEVKNAPRERVAQKAIDEALNDLDEIVDEAREMGYEPPEASIVRSARAFVTRVKHPVVLSVGVWGDGAVSVVANLRDVKGCGVMVVCEKDGSGSCVVQAKKPGIRSWAPDANDPDLLSAFDLALRRLDACRE